MPSVTVTMSSRPSTLAALVLGGITFVSLSLLLFRYLFPSGLTKAITDSKGAKGNSTSSSSDSKDSAKKVEQNKSSGGISTLSYPNLLDRANSRGATTPDSNLSL